MTTARHSWMTPGQIELLTAMVNERFEASDEAGRAPFRAAWYTIDSREDFQAVLDQLKAIPTLARRQADAEREERFAARVSAARKPLVTEPGYYRNPETGELYRIVEHNDNSGWRSRTVLKVAKYSKSGGPRRLDVRGNLVKGKWVQLRKYEGTVARRDVIQADWKIDESGLLEFAYGFCPLHGGSLRDGVSVALGYGPKCAANHGLPYSEDAARKVLVAQGIDPDAFFAEHGKEGKD